VRKVREAKSENRLTPTVRACIILGKILKLKDGAGPGSNGFKQICLDVLMSEVAGKDRKKVSQVIDEALAASFYAGANYV
jgi:hypothetical protein